MTKNRIIIVAGLVIIAGFVLYGASSNWFSFNLKTTQSVTPTANNVPGTLPYPNVGIFYTPSGDKAPYGNFTFQYPSSLIRTTSTLKIGKTGKTNNVVVLSDRYNIDPGAMIEINSPDKTCEDYAVCKEIVGTATSTTGVSKEFARIVIGTNSENPDFLGWFDEVVKSFKVLELPPVPIEVEPQ